jgi:CO/xanthine dehydrogenase Mo-binding subunit
MKTVGKSEIRKDAYNKVTGAALYAADLVQQDTNIGVLVRSPHHSARILRIDIEAARSMPGVLAVLTCNDVSGSIYHGNFIPDQPVLAKEVVRHLGEPVVLVVAQSRMIAEQACAKVLVEYEVLDPVFDPQLALDPNSPKVHPNGNLVTHFDIEDGSVVDGFKAADVIIEDVFSSPRVSPGYMEPENSLAYWEDDTLVVWVSSQHPFVDRAVISEVLGLPLTQVRVKSAAIGGAFGGKEDAQIPVLAALGAWAVKGPVRVVNNRHESFQAHPKRHPAKLHFKIGATSDGIITALEAIVFLDTGAYASLGPAVAGNLTEMVQGSYYFPNLHVETFLTYTNSPMSGAMRGFGSPQAQFALESIMDMLANKLGISPLELRRKNILKPGSKMFTRVVMNNSALALPLILDKAEEIITRWHKKAIKPGNMVGFGVALGCQPMGLGKGVLDELTNRVVWQPDGSVLVYLGADELGQGLMAAAEQMTAEALGLPYEKVFSVPPDTMISPIGHVTCASRITYMVGNSLLKASEALVESLLDHATVMLGVEREELTYSEGMIIKSDGQKVPVTEFIGRLAEDNVLLSADATFSFPYPEETTPTHLPIGIPHVMFYFGANVVRVEVDQELGKVNVTDIAAIHDVGKVINRAGVEGQIEGGVSMGLGFALYEEMFLKSSGHWVDGFTEYLIPTIMDMPMNLETIILEVPEASGPFGAKGIGEVTLVPTAPAIANAIADALGVRLTEAPMTPERILAAIKHLNA